MTETIAGVLIAGVAVPAIAAAAILSRILDGCSVLHVHRPEHDEEPSR